MARELEDGEVKNDSSLIPTVPTRNDPNYEEHVGLGLKNYHIHGLVKKKVKKMHKTTEIVVMRIYITPNKQKHVFYKC